MYLANENSASSFRWLAFVPSRGLERIPLLIFFSLRNDAVDPQGARPTNVQDVPFQISQKEALNAVPCARRKSSRKDTSS